MKYMTRMGQNTGMLKNSKNVHVMAITTALVAAYLQGENATSKFFNVKKLPYFSHSHSYFSSTILSKGGRCNEANPM